MAESWPPADDVAVHVGITKDTAHTWIADKRVPAHKPSRLWKFQAGEVDDRVHGRESAATDASASDPPRGRG